MTLSEEEENRNNLVRKLIGDSNMRSLGNLGGGLERIVQGRCVEGMRDTGWIGPIREGQGHKWIAHCCS